MKIVCDNIDRLVTTEIRLPYMDRGIISRLYEAARGNGDPIVYSIASAIKEMLGEGKPKFGIVTGFWHPEHLPDGENDGPIGAVALGKALYLAGAEVIYCVEKEVIPVMQKMCEYLNIPANTFALSRESADYNAKLADELDGVIFTEKCGATRAGVYHFATGGARPGQDAKLETMLERMLQLGKLTIGIGDNGNEIGFGKIYNEACEITRYGKTCKCPAQEGIVSIMATDYLLPASTSNLGAYGIVAAIALLTEKVDLLHQPEDELELIRICTEMNCIDGGFGQAHDYVDGISAKTVAALVQVLKEMVTIYFDSGRRVF